MKKIDPKVVQEHFDWRSEDYSNLFNRRTRTGAAFNFQTRQNLISEIAAGYGGRMLECASGTGEITLAALRNGSFQSATINDFSPKMLEQTKKLLNEKTHVPVEFINKNVFDLGHDLAGNKFDFILCVGLLAHVGQLNQLMCELRKLVSDDGTILLQNTSLGHAGIKITKMLSEKRHIQKHGYAIRHYYHGQIAKAANEASLHIQDEARFGINIPFFDRIGPGINYRIEKSLSRLGNWFGAETIYTLKPTQIHSDKSHSITPARITA